MLIEASVAATRHELQLSVWSGVGCTTQFDDINTCCTFFAAVCECSVQHIKYRSWCVLRRFVAAEHMGQLLPYI
jgi:hypothetical protein